MKPEFSGFYGKNNGFCPGCLFFVTIQHPEKSGFNHRKLIQKARNLSTPSAHLIHTSRTPHPRKPVFDVVQLCS